MPVVSIQALGSCNLEVLLAKKRGTDGTDIRIACLEFKAPNHVIPAHCNS